jgi:serine/threonine protein kinase
MWDKSPKLNWIKFNPIYPNLIQLFIYIEFKIIDFGLARRVEMVDGKSHFSTELVKGSPGFAAPEVSSGQVCNAADIFSLGVLVLATATGLPATHNGERKELLRFFVKNTLRDFKERQGDLGALLCSSALAASSCDWTFPGGAEALRELLDIGLLCSHDNKRSRPALLSVVPRLKRVLADLKARA